MADRIIVPTVRNVEAWRLAAELCVKTGGLSGEFDWPQVVISLCREWEKHNTTVVNYSARTRLPLES